ncbi:MAG: hypothetical protein ACTHOE_01675 [Conexibacter sp.]
MIRSIRSATAVAAVLLALAVLALAGTASATSPHFVRDSATGPTNAGQLLVSFKEAGLGDNQLIRYRASADGSATYACINGGDRHPQATNKESFTGPVTAEGAFRSGKNGSISQTLTLNPPGPGDFTCPPGQRRILADVSYANVAITDLTNDVSESVPGGPFNRVFFAL